MAFRPGHGQVPNVPPTDMASGLQQAARIASIGAPTGVNLRPALHTSTPTGPNVVLPTDGFNFAPQQSAFQQQQLQQQQQQQQPLPASPAAHSTAPLLVSNNSFPQYDPPRRSQTLHHSLRDGMQPSISQPPSQPLQPLQPHQHQQQHLPPYAPSDAHLSAHSTPGISLQQAPAPHSSLYNNPSSAASVPGSLQPGGAGRPPLQQAYSASSSSGPPPPQISSNAQQYTLPTRTNTMSQASHSYSRSSPAGLDQQKYVPFSGHTDNQRYPQTPNSKYYQPQTPTGLVAQSPLALEQIRPRANSSILDDGMGGTSLFGDMMDRAPTNSNYMAPWAVFAFDWCKYPVSQGNSAGKMAIGSYLEDPHNFIQIVDTHIVPQEVVRPGDPAYGIEYTRVAEATCSYPVTRILWEPPISQKQSTDLLATSGDHLRLWSLPSATNLPQVQSNTITRSSSVNQRQPTPQKLTPLALLSNSKTPEHTAPLTSLDWNTLSPKLIITSSIDTTCTIWDIPTLTAKTQLIAHDKEVFDVRFCAGSVDVFVSCGADGSVRMFDLRSLEHSTIIYEPSDKNSNDKNTPPGRPMTPTTKQQTLTTAPPLLRLAASPHDSHLLSTFAADSNIVRILDVRQPGQALLELRGHSGHVNAVEWAPTRRGMLASGGDDSMVLVWDLLRSGQGGGAIVSGDLAPQPQPPPAAAPQGGNGVSAGPGAPQNPQAGQAQPTPTNVAIKGPAASWNCDFEVANLSWAPTSGLTGQGGEWVGVAGGRGVWGVKM